ncbi:uncharacterized protein BJ212DRAFT_1278733, partial [Suillus subaureus]
AVEPVVIRFNGTVYFPSIYHINSRPPEAPDHRSPPPPELDTAWARISDDDTAFNLLPIRVTIDDLRKAGEVDLLAKAKYPQSNGGGFMASLEVNHQLRCPNFLRKSCWSDHYWLNPGFRRDPSVVRMHLGNFPFSPDIHPAHGILDDCAELIGQSIMCDAEVAMITWDWVTLS